MTLHAPFRIVKCGGREKMQLPEGAAQPRRPDTTLVKALAGAFRWKRMLESGEFATIAELAEREAIPSTYMARVLRLTLLAPDIVEAIPDGNPDTDYKRELMRFLTNEFRWEEATEAGELRLENTGEVIECALILMSFPLNFPI